MHKPNFRITPWLPVACGILYAFLLQSCGIAGIDRLVELKAFEDSVAARYQVKDIDVVLSGDTDVELIFTNSQYQNSPDSVKRAMALETGRILLAVCPKEKAFRTGTLIISEEKRRLLAERRQSELFDMQLEGLRNEQQAATAE